MMLKSKLSQSLVVILAFFIGFYGHRMLITFTDITIAGDYLRLVYRYAWWLVPAALATAALFGFRNILRLWGLDRDAMSAFLFAGVSVLPMLLGSALTGKMMPEIEWLSFLQSTLIAGFTEEVFFRAFLFGILFFRLGWGFIPAALIGAVLFGMGHVYQGSSLAETLGIFAVTAMGAVWFAWLYAEWDQNIWVPVWLHVLMNLSWTLFDVSDNALGGLYSNLFRVVTIAITILLTLRMRRGRGLFVRKGRLWVMRDGC